MTGSKIGEAMGTASHFLLVEDDPNDVALITTAFRLAGNESLLIVSDGQEAVDYMSGESPYDDRKEFPFPDVILLDLKMPRVNGLEFLQWLRNEAPNAVRLLPVVIMSSSHQAEDVQRAYELGVNSYVHKPINWPMFAQRIKVLNEYWSAHVEKPPVAGIEQPAWR